jgi:F-type H+-transporting ATPase subunit alpha
MMELLKQGLNSPVPVPKQVAALYAGWNGYLDSIAVDKVLKFESDLHASLDEEKTILEAIRTEKNISEDTEKKLIEVIERVVELNK